MRNFFHAVGWLGGKASEQFTDTPLRAAVIGLGYLGSLHAQKYFSSPNTTLLAVCDTDTERSSFFSRRFGCESIRDLRQLKELGVECASVVTPTGSHYQIARQLLALGIDVLLEKPMTATAREGESLVRFADQRGRILQVGHLERFNPAFRAARQVLTEPRFCEVKRIAPFRDRGTDVSVVFDLMIHDLDILLHIIGKPVRDVDAIGTPVLTSSPDIVNARLVFEGGAIANVTASRVALNTERTIRIFQPEAYISLDFGKNRLKIGTLDPDGSKPLEKRISLKHQKIARRDALADELESFLRCVAYRVKPEVDGRDGLEAIRVATRVQEAIDRSAAVSSTVHSAVSSTEQQKPIAAAHLASLHQTKGVASNGDLSC